jgi:hypothetical protein
MSIAVTLPFPWLDQSESNDEASTSGQASWHSSDSLTVSRSSHRISFTERMCVTGLNADHSACSAPLLVRGRDISVDGVSFTHQRPMPHRHVQMLLPLASGLESVIVRLTWCRFAGAGAYVSGGYFVRQANMPSSAPEDWDTLDEA